MQYTIRNKGDMGKFYDRLKDAYVFEKKGESCDVLFKADIEVTGSIYARSIVGSNLTAKDIHCVSIDCSNIKADSLRCVDVIAENLDVKQVYVCTSVECNKIESDMICVGKLVAENIESKTICAKTTKSHKVNVGMMIGDRVSANEINCSITCDITKELDCQEMLGVGRYTFGQCINERA